MVPMNLPVSPCSFAIFTFPNPGNIYWNFFAEAENWFVFAILLLVSMYRLFSEQSKSSNDGLRKRRKLSPTAKMLNSNQAASIAYYFCPILLANI
jgi:hypothetical protein